MHFSRRMLTSRHETGWSHITDQPNFGHFVFEYLSRVPIFEMLRLPEHLPVVIYDCVPEAWEGFLELAGIKRERLVRIPILGGPAFRKVWMASACNYRDTRGKYHLWAPGLHSLRQRVFMNIGGAQLDKRRRIYLGRNDARWRRVANEPAVIEVLHKYGFEALDIRNLTQRQQVEAISGAELVVNAVGAGSVLTYFAPGHCTIIDLAPVNAVAGYWGGLGAALMLGQVHERIDCEVVSSEHERLNIYGTNELADYRVDLDTLKKNLDMAIARIGSEVHSDASQL